MPNVMGGDQFHPAYDCRTPVGEDQVLVGNTLWTADKDGRTASYEDVDGSRGTGPVPKELAAKLARRKA